MDLLRSVPPVHRFVTDPDIAKYHAILGRTAVKTCVQAVLEDARAALATARIPVDESTLRSHVLARLAAAEAEGLLAVINGSGVLLHTNFGRAPLSERALAAVSALGSGYTNLEYDLEDGKRGSRYDRVSSQLRELSGSQDSVVVNNCAAAVLLVLDTFARGKEVVVSRGQLIEIGGGFRLPDVLRKSGATLIEVGTTNKTYPRDYRDAWTSNTALFMRSHPSNYRIEGFTAEVDARTLAMLAKELGVISFEDLGSGAVVDLRRFGLPAEPTLAEEIAAGLDLVAVSGDKLLGGPQCGIIVGSAERIAVMKRNPLLRALRVDKMTIAALSATLSVYLDGDRLREIPLFAMLSLSQEELLERAGRLCSALRDRAGQASIAAVRTVAATGGGTLPLAEIPSAGIAVEPHDHSVDAYAARLRRRRPPVVGRVDGRSFVVDLRTVRPGEDPVLAEALSAALDSAPT